MAKPPAQLHPHWPVLRSFTGKYLRRVAMPLGGIGTGSVSISGRGHLCNWEIINRPAEGWDPGGCFFALRAQAAGKPPVARCLEGEPSPADLEEGRGRPISNPGLPRFRNARFDAAYPFGQVSLSDPEVPLRVRIEAFNPMIPADAERSGIPVAVLRFVLINATDRPVSGTVCGTIRNFIGRDGTSIRKSAKRCVNRYLRSSKLRGLEMSSGGLDRRDIAWGTVVLATTASRGVSHRTDWRNEWLDARWGTNLLDFWEDLLADGKLDPREHKVGHEDTPPIASLAVKTLVPPRAERAITFLLSWHFPNRITWNPSGYGGNYCPVLESNALPVPDDVIGNHYCTVYKDAWDVARKTAAQLGTLERETVSFVRAVAISDVPKSIKEAALSTSAVLRTQTCFRTPDGHFFGFEGCDRDQGSCSGSCTHVWNYEQATASLFSELSRSMREVEFEHATREDGMMSFRVTLPLGRKPFWNNAAADGQMGALVRLYLQWRRSGDTEWLRRLWPAARRAMEFCWIPGGWDADRDGVMEGCQHNTYDVEFIGPNPLMTSLYLAALRACETMADIVGETDFGATCRELFVRGSRWMDDNLFNGQFYEQQIRSIASSTIPPELRIRHMGTRDTSKPDFQLGGGCLIDQLLGQYVAHVAGLGRIAEPRNIRKTLQSIYRYNFRDSMRREFNFLRSYAMSDDAGTLMCTYPLGKRPRRPFPYATETWTGCEYAFASLLIYEGMRDRAIKVIDAVRNRHDGERRNPFDEPECGRYYARSMSAWATLLAWTGFHYNATTGCITFRASDKPVTWFWSTGAAWGIVRLDSSSVDLRVLGGSIRVKQICITGIGNVELKRPNVMRNGNTLRAKVTPRGSG
jgi:uncharacterized protein (DUF608 family)